MKLVNVEKRYVLKKTTIEVLKNINYEFKNNHFYAIKGHSGSGKSTLIKILGLMEPLSSGKYYIEGKEISTLNDEEMSKIRMKYIGFVFQDFNLDENLNALDNVILPMLINKEIKREERKSKAQQILVNLGLKEQLKHYPEELSGGEQQRVAIARALSNNPQVILADEPTGNLDKENEKIVFQELKKLSNAGKCVIVVTHSNEINEYADVILYLKDGTLKDKEF